MSSALRNDQQLSFRRINGDVRKSVPSELDVAVGLDLCELVVEDVLEVPLNRRGEEGEEGEEEEDEERRKKVRKRKELKEKRK